MLRNSLIQKLLIVLLALILLILSVVYWQRARTFEKIIERPATHNEAAEFKLEEPISILALGADSLIPGDLKGWTGRSDFIALFYANPFTDKVSVLSIPRDTKVKLKKYPITKINSANQIGGYKLARRSVQKLLGMKIQHVVVFSIQAVIDLVNELGPLKIYVPHKMSYHDNSADLHIEFEPGLQTMDGKQIMNFLRYRSTKMGDIGRIERQQIFFRAALKKLKEPKTIFKLPSILYKANKVFLTDMNFDEMFRLGILLRSLSSKNFQSFILPGDFGEKGHWIANPAKLKTLMEKITETSTIESNEAKQ